MALPAEAASTPPEPASGFAAELAISPASGHARGPAPSGPAAAHGGLAPSQNGPEKVEARLAKVLGKLDVKKDDRAQAATAAMLKKAELANAAKEAKRLAEEQREAEVIATPDKQKRWRDIYNKGAPPRKTRIPAPSRSPELKPQPLRLDQFNLDQVAANAAMIRVVA